MLDVHLAHAESYPRGVVRGDDRLPPSMRGRTNKTWSVIRANSRRRHLAAGEPPPDVVTRARHGLRGDGFRCPEFAHAVATGDITATPWRHPRVAEWPRPVAGTDMPTAD